MPANIARNRWNSRAEESRLSCPRRNDLFNSFVYREELKWTNG